MRESIVVVDTSLAVMWAIEEPHSDAATSCLERWLEDSVWMIAPTLFGAEAANALHRAEVRGALDREEAETALGIVFHRHLDLMEVANLPGRAMELARELNRPSVYDCYYLALAEWFDCRLWTGDERFYNAVNRRTDRVRWVGERLDS